MFETGFQLMTFRLVANAKNHCATLLDKNLGGKDLYKIMLDFIFYFVRKYVTYNTEVSHTTLRDFKTK